VIQLVSCHRCNGFLALALRACPHCNAPLDRARRALVGLAAMAGGSAVSMTLMACYGSACVDEECHSYGNDDAAADAGRIVSEPTIGDAATTGDADASRDAGRD
jgi:hypothetical protein